MGAVQDHMWKKLVEQAEKAEKSAKKFEPSVPKNKWRFNNKGCDTAQSSQFKGKETMAVEFSGEFHQSRRGETLAIIRNPNPAEGVFLQR